MCLCFILIDYFQFYPLLDREDTHQGPSFQITYWDLICECIETSCIEAWFGLSCRWSLCCLEEHMFCSCMNCSTNVGYIHWPYTIVKLHCIFISLLAGWCVLCCKLVLNFPTINVSESIHSSNYSICCICLNTSLSCRIY